MPIRVIHGNGDLIGAAAAGVGEGFDRFQKSQLADREMADREARTAAYEQRVTDAKALADARAELEIEEAEAERRREDARRQAAKGVAGARVNQLSQSSGWTKDDEAAIRAIYANKDLTPKEQEKLADTHFDLATQRIAEEGEQLERMKIGDRLTRAMQPDASGLPLIDEDTAAAYQERLESGEPSWRVRADFDREVKAARMTARTNREMMQAGSVLEEAKAMPTLNSEQAGLIDDIEAKLDEGDITPRQAMFQARAVMNGDEDQLREFAALVAQQVQAQGGAQAQADAANMSLGQRGAAGEVEAPEVQKALESLDTFLAESERTPEEMEAWAAKHGVDLEQVLIAAERRVAEKVAASSQSEPMRPETFMGGYQEAGPTLSLHPSQGALEQHKAMRSLK